MVSFWNNDWNKLVDLKKSGLVCVGSWDDRRVGSSLEKE